MSEAGNQKTTFYSDADQKWMSLPSTGHMPSGQTWEFVDSDAGLVYFQCNIDWWFWLWVCNPLEPSLSRLIRPKFDRRDAVRRIPQALKVKLQVDRASGTYKIIAKLDRLPSTAVYESAKGWTCHQNCHPAMGPKEFFVWGSKLYAYSMRKDWNDGQRWLAVFNMKKPKWERIEGKIPCEVNVPTNCILLSNNKEVILVLSSNRRLYRPYFSVWKLLDGGSKFAPGSFCQLENWKKSRLNQKELWWI